MKNKVLDITHKNYITILGRKIRCNEEEIDLDKLKFYEENPRVRSRLERYEDHLTQEEINDIMWAVDDSAHDLYGQIEAHGGLIEPLIVSNNMVIEGNTRLCALKHLYKNDPSPKWKKARCKVIEEKIDHKELIVLLGNYHIVGKNPWEAYEKANFFKELIKCESMDIDEVQKLLGNKLTKKEIQDHIDAVELMKAHNIDLDKDMKKFSYFYEYVKSRKLNKWREEDRDADKKFVGLVKNGRLPKGEMVRNLNVVIKSKKAFNKLSEGSASFEEALYIAEEKNPELASTFYSQVKKMTQKFKEIGVVSLRNEVEEDPKKKKLISNLYKAVKKICEQVGVK